MASGALAGIRVVAFEARRAEELATLLGRHGASVTSAPALRETRLPGQPGGARAGATGSTATRWAPSSCSRASGRARWRRWSATRRPRLLAALGRVPVVARGPKPLAALRELGVSGARPVPAPHTWREALAVLDGVGLAPGALVAVQEYGVPPPVLVQAIEARGLRVLRVPVYRWALPADTGPLERAAAASCGASSTSPSSPAPCRSSICSASAPDAEAMRAALARTVVVSIGPVCSEALEAHGVHAAARAVTAEDGPARRADRGARARAGADVAATRVDTDSRWTAEGGVGGGPRGNGSLNDASQRRPLRRQEWTAPPVSPRSTPDPAELPGPRLSSRSLSTAPRKFGTSQEFGAVAGL